MFVAVMARQVRVECANAVYHLTTRGNERKASSKGGSKRTWWRRTLARADRLVFGGEALWEQVRGLIAEPKGDEETGLTGKWSRE